MSNRLTYLVPGTIDQNRMAQGWRIADTLVRTQLFSGTLAGIAGYGIVDSRDPSTTVEGSTRPFTVTASGTSLAVSVTAGSVLFGNGEFLTLPAVPGIAVPNTYLGERHVFYLQFSEEGHDPRYQDNDILQDTWTGALANPVGYFRIARMVDYQALAQTTRTLLTVPLALLTPTNTGVTVDQSRAELAANRPWATAVDISHRSQVGSGRVTPRNVHGLAFSDMSSGDLAFYDFLLANGTVVAKDVSIAGVPGRLCEETIPPLGIFEDVNGSVTGVVGAYWFRVGKFPTQLFSCVDSANPTTEIACVQIPRKNVLFFFPGDEWVNTMSLTVRYAAVDAASPPPGSNLVGFDPGQPIANETIISGGSEVPSVTGVASFATVGPYPTLATVYLTDSGEVRRVPETLKCDIRLDNAPGNQPTEIQPFIPSVLRVGLRGAIASPSMLVEIDITGTRAEDDVVVTETVTFGAGYSEPVIPTTTGDETDSQWVTTVTTFSNVSYYTVKTRINDGPNSAITIQALTNTNDVSVSNDLAIANIFWDGLQMTDIQDARPIRIAATADPQNIQFAATAMVFADTTKANTVAPEKAIVGAWYDDFQYPQWVSDRGTTLSRWSQGSGPRDTYYSRPILVRPTTGTAVALRVAPVEADRGFLMWVRVFTANTNAWSPWELISSFTNPKYSRVFAPGDQLVKWQFRVQGSCQGIMGAYVATSDSIPPTFIFDSGAFGVDTLG